MSASAVALRLRATHAAASTWLQPLAVVGVVLAVAWLVVAVLAPWLSPYDPLDQAARLYQPPSIEHVFGTDDLGRDVFSRVLWASRLSLPLAFFLVAMAVAILMALRGCRTVTQVAC